MRREAPPNADSLANPGRRAIKKTLMMLVVPLLILILSIVFLATGSARKLDSNADFLIIHVSTPIRTVTNNGAIEQVKGNYYGKETGGWFKREASPLISLGAVQQGTIGKLRMVRWVFYDEEGNPVSDTYGKLQSSLCRDAPMPGKDCEFNVRDPPLWDEFAIRRASLFCSMEQSRFWLVMSIFGVAIGVTLSIGGIVQVCTHAFVSKKFCDVHKVVLSEWYDADTVLVLNVSEERAAAFTEASLGPGGRKARGVWSDLWKVFLVSGPACAVGGVLKSWAHGMRGLTDSGTVYALVGFYVAGVLLDLGSRWLSHCSNRCRYKEETLTLGAQQLIFVCPFGLPATMLYRRNGLLFNSLDAWSALLQEEDGWVFRCMGQGFWQGFEEVPVEDEDVAELRSWMECGQRCRSFKFRSLGVELSGSASKATNGVAL